RTATAGRLSGRREPSSTCSGCERSQNHSDDRTAVRTRPALPCPGDPRPRGGTEVAPHSGRAGQMSAAGDWCPAERVVHRLVELLATRGDAADGERRERVTAGYHGRALVVTDHEAERAGQLAHRITSHLSCG